MMAQLDRPLSLMRGTALLLNIVIGAGLLILPGLALHRVGGMALMSWLVCALAALPLLGVFIIMGRRYPDAGGVAHFVSRAFGKKAYIVASLWLLGAVIFGLPSIALTGGYYLAFFVKLPPHWLAIFLVLAGTAIHLLSSDMAAKINTAIASLLLIAILALLVTGFWAILASGQTGMPILLPTIDTLPLLLAPFAMLFFAFTGWEVGAGLGEEFAKPRRDFPLAMIASFVIATFLYLAIAFVSQHLDLGDRYEVPFLVMIDPILGSKGAIAVALLAGAIVFANLSGAIWAISRLVFSLSREEVLPSLFQDVTRGVPLRAIAATAGSILLVLGLDAMGLFGIERMLALAGQNFLLLYGFTAAALLKLAAGRAEKLLALFVLLLVLVLFFLQGLHVLYPLFLGAIGLGIYYVQHRKKVIPASSEA